MRYLCMVCYEQKALDDLSKPEFDCARDRSARVR